jgi:hypothetical protein
LLGEHPRTFQALKLVQLPGPLLLHSPVPGENKVVLKNMYTIWTPVFILILFFCNEYGVGTKKYHVDTLT